MKKGRPSRNTGRHGQNPSPAPLESILLDSFFALFGGRFLDEILKWIFEALDGSKSALDGGNSPKFFTLRAPAEADLRLGGLGALNVETWDNM